MSVFIGVAVFAVLVLAFFNFGFVERAGNTSSHEVQRRLFDANTITFMSSFILVVLFSIFISTQNRVADQSRELEKQISSLEKEKKELSSSIEHIQQLNRFIIDAQAICNKCILLLYMIDSSREGNQYVPNKAIRSTFSECTNEIKDLELQLKNSEKNLSTHEKHAILAPLVDSNHKFQAFQTMNKKFLDKDLKEHIDGIMGYFTDIGVK